LSLAWETNLNRQCPLINANGEYEKAMMNCPSKY
jgi:hypothetical protein